MIDLTPAPAIERFVRHRLGCTCPDEAFRQIEWRSVVLPASRIPLLRITIGERLLVEVIPFEALERPEVEVSVLLERGARTRDDLGLNRYRLALVVEDGAARLDAGVPDERVHLHWVRWEDVAGLPLAPGKVNGPGSGLESNALIDPRKWPQVESTGATLDVS